MKKYLLHGKLKAKEGKGEELSSILLEAAQTLTAAKGCDLYAIGKDANDTDSVWVTEIWHTKEDHDNSLKLESVRSVIMKAMPILDGMPQKGQELEIVGGLGV
ncbi:antibiotic biosynthesis monooxygenase [Sphingobacteriaceae bacterium]|nr:antibiotic biosynthesis monooxygenase [Sphingobacteriaceae bacterium]